MSYFSKHLGNVSNINISCLNHLAAYTERLCWLNNISDSVYMKKKSSYLGFSKENKRQFILKPNVSYHGPGPDSISPQTVF